MNTPKWLILALGTVLIALGYAYQGWAGVAAVTGALVMLLLLQVSNPRDGAAQARRPAPGRLR